MTKRKLTKNELNEIALDIGEKALDSFWYLATEMIEHERLSPKQEEAVYDIIGETILNIT